MLMMKKEKKMRIHNVRLGFATNSSSTHSIVIFPNPKETVDDAGDFEFQWNYFTASSRSSKAGYMAIILTENLKHFVTEGQATFITTNLLGKGTLKAIEDGSIDHQSMMMLPRDYKGQMVNLEFAKDLSNYIINNDRIAILGGNDQHEGDEFHPLASAGDEVYLGLPKDEWLPLICRKEGPGLWTLFNKQTGAKIRLSFNDPEPPRKAIAPALADIKITDHCDMGCQFCYQSSTANGKHGEIDYIKGVLSSLSELEVFECALGGGETTSHPMFLDILRYGIGKGLTINFTTKSLQWLRDKDYALKVLDCVGGFAYSVGSRGEILGLVTALDELNVSLKGKASCQLVMGTVDKAAFMDILKTCSSNGLRVTLLGYKTTGFGASYKPQDYSWWLDVIKELDEEGKIPYLGIDTQLAKEFKGGLEKAGISKYMYRVHEGEDSCYIDCVNKKMAPSSYCHPELYKDLPYPYSDLKETWDELEVI